MSIESAKSLLAAVTAKAATTPANAQPQAKVARAEQAEQVKRAAEAQAAAKPSSEPTEAAPSLESVAARIDQYLKSVSRTLEFRVDGPSGHTVVSVRDTETGDLIRQFPNEEVLRLAEMAEDQTIVLVNEKV
jgi:flagellar protein FlaG